MISFADICIGIALSFVLFLHYMLCNFFGKDGSLANIYNSHNITFFSTSLMIKLLQLGHKVAIPYGLWLHILQTTHTPKNRVCSTYTLFWSWMSPPYICIKGFTPIHNSCNLSINGYKYTSTFVDVTDSFIRIIKTNIKRYCLVISQGGKL
jgi:hypothetical protein